MADQTHEAHIEQMHGTHDPEGAHEHAHGWNSFMDRWWQAFVIGFGCVFVFVLTHYSPTAN